jgi:hypothetical protein
LSTYTRRSATTSLVLSGCFIILAHALEWNGFLMMSAQSTDGIKTYLLQSYEWNVIEGNAISSLYERQVAWLWLAATSLMIYSGMIVTILISCLVWAPRQFSSGLAALSLGTTFFTNVPLFFVTSIINQSPARHATPIGRLRDDTSLLVKMATPANVDWTKDYSPFFNVMSPQHAYFLVVFWLTLCGLTWFTFAPGNKIPQ